jgi:hypothetical protein
MGVVLRYLIEHIIRELLGVGVEKICCRRMLQENRILKLAQHVRASAKNEFPPRPLSKDLIHDVATGFCKSMAPSKFVEGGCAVCGQLVLLTDLIRLTDTECDLNILLKEGAGVTRKERLTDNHPIEEINGPIIDDQCSAICSDCNNSLMQGSVPDMALANNLWIGNVPAALQGLTYAEKLLVARVRHNRCVVRVKSGMHKMKANAITFANPIPKVYHALPPPLEELDEVLAFIYTGPCHPTVDDLKRTPLLVRRKKVTVALEWLKLNHIGYADLEISYKNLEDYPEDGPPVVIDYRHSSGERILNLLLYMTMKMKMVPLLVTVHLLCMVLLVKNLRLKV